ncbi:hypothetical protein BPUN_2301 [Candidatus Paraburkholderia kirkii]|nr:hypothetical protein BPUN_2301 [Candidatus Paraburkholderia kirkii]
MSLSARPGADLHHTLHAASANLPTFLLIHPLGADHTFCDVCIDVWRGRIACLACDLRCAGESPGADRPPSIATYVADLHALCVSLGIGTVAPVGCAIGAMIAAAYAAAHPDAAVALVLSNPVARSSAEAARRLAERARLVQGGGMQAILPGTVERPFLNQPDDARRAHYCRHPLSGARCSRGARRIVSSGRSPGGAGPHSGRALRALRRRGALRSLPDAGGLRRSGPRLSRRGSA